MLAKQSDFSSQVTRFDAVDSLRGLAMVWMTAYHFCFDLNQYGYIRQDFYADPTWTWQRVAIVSIFLFCAGAGQAIAVRRGQTWAHFWQRWLQIVGCALLVSASSYLMFPNSWIYFGVLHGIALMLIVVRFCMRSGQWLWVLGALLIAAKFLGAWALDARPEANFFNSHWVNWLGLITQKPVTEDYLPLIPWMGVMFWGAASTNWLLQIRPDVLDWKFPYLNMPLVTLGRWSLLYYMLHQPIIIGCLMLIAWLK